MKAKHGTPTRQRSSSAATRQPRRGYDQGQSQGQGQGQTHGLTPAERGARGGLGYGYGERQGHGHDSRDPSVQSDDMGNPNVEGGWAEVDTREHYEQQVRCSTFSYHPNPHPIYLPTLLILIFPA